MNLDKYIHLIRAALGVGTLIEIGVSLESDRGILIDGGTLPCRFWVFQLNLLHFKSKIKYKMQNLNFGVRFYKMDIKVRKLTVQRVLKKQKTF